MGLTSKLTGQTAGIISHTRLRVVVFVYSQNYDILYCTPHPASDEIYASPARQLGPMQRPPAIPSVALQVRLLPAPIAKNNWNGPKYP
eukprot:scaffold208085_cov18-Prasinocladus_malaysianus.AAC.2